MKLIVLGAGYATRLYPLTLNQPKPLLPVAGKPMLEHVLDNLQSLTNLDHIYIVTNAKFAIFSVGPMPMRQNMKARPLPSSMTRRRTSRTGSGRLATSIWS